MTEFLLGCELYRFYHNGDEETAALRGVSISLKRGDFVVLVGPSGSGKSTLLACLAGLDDPDGGTVSLMGERISRRPEGYRAKLRARHVGILMQTGNLFDHLDVAANIQLQQDLARVRKPRPAPELLARLGLERHASALPAQLSGGEATRAGLAVALASGASLLICDEPTAEVDSATEEAVIALLREEQMAGVALLVATHSAVLAKAADRVVRIEDGRLL